MGGAIDYDKQFKKERDKERKKNREKEKKKEKKRKEKEEKDALKRLKDFSDGGKDSGRSDLKPGGTIRKITPADIIRGKRSSRVI